MASVLGTLMLAAVILWVQPTVTYENLGAPASRVLPELGKQLGMTLNASSAVANEILCVRLDAATVEEVLARISWATDCSWETHSDGSRWLTRTSTDEQRAKRREESMFQEALARARAEFVPLTDLDEPAADSLRDRYRQALARAAEPRGAAFRAINALEREGPGARLLSRLGNRLPLNELAKHADGSRVVFSTAPNRMQRPFPIEISSELQQFRRENELLRTKLEIGKVQDPVVNGITYRLLPERSDSREIAKVRMAVTRFGSSMSASILVLDPLGGVIAQAQNALAVPDLPHAQPAPDDDLPVAVTPEAARLYSEDQVRRERLANPERFEPLADAVGDLLVSSARARGMNLVASLSEENLLGDILVTAYFEQLRLPQGIISSPPTLDHETLSGAARVGAVRRNLAPTYDSREENGWWSLRPRHAFSNGSHRLPRPALGRLLRRLRDPKGVPIEELSSLLVNFRPGWRTWRILNRVANRFGLFSANENAWNLRHFYGSLSEAQQESLSRGVPVRDLTGPQALMLRRLVFEGDPPFHSRPLDQFERRQPLPVMRPAADEPTEVFPDGIPSGLVIRRLEQTDTLVDDAASRKSRRGNLDYYAMTRQGKLPEAVRTGRSRRIALCLIPESGVALQAELESRVYDSDGDLPFEQLPVELRERLRARILELAKATLPRPSRSVPPPSP